MFEGDDRRQLTLMAMRGRADYYPYDWEQPRPYWLQRLAKVVSHPVEEFRRVSTIALKILDWSIEHGDPSSPPLRAEHLRKYNHVGVRSIAALERLGWVKPAEQEEFHGLPWPVRETLKRAGFETRQQVISAMCRGGLNFPRTRRDPRFQALNDAAVRQLLAWTGLGSTPAAGAIAPSSLVQKISPKRCAARLRALRMAAHHLQQVWSRDAVAREERAKVVGYLRVQIARLDRLRRGGREGVMPQWR